MLQGKPKADSYLYTTIYVNYYCHHAYFAYHMLHRYHAALVPSLTHLRKATNRYHLCVASKKVAAYLNR